MHSSIILEALLFNEETWREGEIFGHNCGTIYNDLKTNINVHLFLIETFCHATCNK